MPISRNELNWTKPRSGRTFCITSNIEKRRFTNVRGTFKKRTEESEDVELVTTNAEDTDLENAKSSDAEDPLSSNKFRRDK